MTLAILATSDLPSKQPSNAFFLLDPGWLVIIYFDLLSCHKGMLTLLKKSADGAVARHRVHYDAYYDFNGIQ
jgi:hypothetical protein